MLRALRPIRWTMQTGIGSAEWNLTKERETDHDLNQPPERNCPGGFSLYGLFHDAALMALKSLFFNELNKSLPLKIFRGRKYIQSGVDELFKNRLRNWRPSILDPDCECG